MPPLKRALLLLSASCPESTLQDLLNLPIGCRDLLLMDLMQLTFGPGIECVTECQECGEMLEMSFQVDDIRAYPPGPPESGLSVSRDGLVVRFRLPTSRDLLDLQAKDLTRARSILMERCVLSVRRDDHEEDEPEQSRIPEEVVAEMQREMERADPLSNLRLSLNCPSCSLQWEANFDIVSYFWTEIDHWARNMLHDIHIIASAYGWREADILAMSPHRRRIYLEMLDR